MPDFWTMNVHECPQCGSYLRFGGDLHECGPRDDSHIRYNLATTDEEKAALSEAVRLLHGIDEAFWYRNRPEVLAIVQRLHRDCHRFTDDEPGHMEPSSFVKRLTDRADES